jgi:hypothetical protein
LGIKKLLLNLLDNNVMPLYKEEKILTPEEE